MTVGVVLSSEGGYGTKRGDLWSRLLVLEASD